MAQVGPGAPSEGGASLPQDMREGGADAGLPVPGRQVPQVMAQALVPLPDTPEGTEGLGVVTHVPGGATTARAASLAVRAAAMAQTLPAAASRAVAPQDDRTLVQDTGEWPSRAAGLLVAEFAGFESSCSAALIGPSSVLTAAHCVYDHSAGWAVSLRFVPGQNGSDLRPFGSWPVTAIHVPTGFLLAPDADYERIVGYDLAVLGLRAPVGDALGWFGYGAAMVDPAQGGAGIEQVARVGWHAMLSYPADKPTGTQWRGECAIWPLTAAPDLIGHSCTTFAGASGAPMFPRDTNAAPRISAVNVAMTPDHNLAVMIGPAYAAWLNELWR